MTTHVLMLAIRLGLGWYLAGAGWDKVQGELAGGLGTFYAGDSFQGRTPSWLPAALAVPFGYMLPWAELLCGALVMAGLFGRAAAVGAAVIFASIAVALYNAGSLLPRHHLMVFLPVALLLASHGPGRYSLDVFARRRAFSGAAR